MTSINVVVHGVLGKMGQEVLNAVTLEKGLIPVGAADELASATSISLPNSKNYIPLSKKLSDVIEHSNVIIDFSRSDGAMSVLRTAAPAKVNVVIGTTGLSEDDFQEAKKLADTYEIGVVIAPNFAVGAVLMMHLANISAKYFDYADLTEMHSEGKLDSPSGTAISIAKAAALGRGKPFISPSSNKELISGTRGGEQDGISIHSTRMQGRVAHHNLIFGGLGQTLTIQHDSISRESFMPGVILAVKEVVKTPGLIVGLEKILGL